MKILIIKLSALGDILHSYPVLEYLKQIYPHSSIDWMVEEKGLDLVQKHPLVSRAIPVKRKSLLSSWWQLRKGLSSYDRVIDLQGNCKSALFTWMTNAPIKTGFGPSMVAEWPNLLVTNHKIDPPPGKSRREDYLSFVLQKGVSYIPKRILLQLSLEEEKAILPYKGFDFLIAPGSMWDSKKLSKEQWVDILRAIEGRMLLAWGTEAEHKEAAWIQAKIKNSIVLPKFPLHQLQHIMDSTSTVFAIDSLALHLAATTSAKTISFFGPSSKLKYAPFGKNHFSFQGECPFGITFDRRCPRLRTCKEAPCTKQMDGKKLQEEVQRILHASPPQDG